MGKERKRYSDYVSSQKQNQEQKVDGLSSQGESTTLKNRGRLIKIRGGNQGA